MGLDWYVEVYDRKTNELIEDNDEERIYNGLDYFRAKNLVTLMEKYGMCPKLQYKMYGDVEGVVNFDHIVEVLKLYDELKLKEIKHWTMQEQKDTFQEAKRMANACINLMLMNSEINVKIKASY